MTLPPQPIRFSPIYKERVWGGRTLESKFGRQLPDANQPYGESWEICDREGDQTYVAGGEFDGLSLAELWTNHRERVFGKRLVEHPSPRFPLLLKILDARADLSIQVHPTKKVAAELGGEPKSEAWFIAATEPGAKIYVGLKQGITRESFLEAVNEGRTAEVVGVLEPKPGDYIHLPSGRLHAIGAGVLIFEVQQNSDTTYRIFDWNRMGLDGKPRALHVDEAMRCIDFSDTSAHVGRSDEESLIDCPAFKVDRWQFEGPRLCGSSDECAFFAVMNGVVECEKQTFSEGDFFLLPAGSGDAQLVAKGKAATIIRIAIP